MANMYKMKVYAALLMSPLITVLAFFIVLKFYGFLWSLAGLCGGLLFSVIMSKILIRNPYSAMLEGQGVLVHNLDSTGIMRPFVVQVQSPYINNTKEGVSDVFDRNAVYHYAVPVKNRMPMEMLQDGGVRITLDKERMIKLLDAKEYTTLDLPVGAYRIMDTPKKPWWVFGKKKEQTVRLEFTPEALAKVKEVTKENLIVIELNEQEYNSARFVLMHYPALIWNDQIKSMLTKDFLAGQEKEAFAEHNVLYLNRKMEELTSAIRDFGRYVVELTKPKGDSWLNSKWTWIIIAIVVVIIIAMFLPSIISAIKGTTGSAGGALQTAKGAVSGMTGTITPVNP